MLHMYNRYSKSDTNPTSFEKFIIAEGKSSRATQWLLIDIIPKIRSHPLLTEEAGKEISDVLEEPYGLKNTHEMALYMFYELITSHHGFSRAYRVKDHLMNIHKLDENTIEMIAAGIGRLKCENPECTSHYAAASKMKRHMLQAATADVRNFDSGFLQSGF